MKKLIFSIMAVLATVSALQAQTLKGYVLDAESREPLVGATITYNDRGVARGTTTGTKGEFSLDIPEGGYSVSVTYIGYEDELLHLVVNPRDVIEREILMKQSVSILDNVVVSAGRFEQKLSEITVSMDVLSSLDISRQSPTDITNVLKTLPGVDVNDKQPSIRGGSGWTYGVGSRSLIMVDGMSVLNPGTGEINWNSVAMDNIAQIEVLKGASSVLYGSSALNGIINVRTERPGLVPETNIKLYAGVYGDPNNEDYIWWDKGLWQDGKYPVKGALRNSVFTGVRNPMYEGMDASHTRRIGNFDVTGGMSVLTDEGYRENAYNKRFSAHGNVTYHQPGANYVNYGVNVDFLTNKYGDAFIWRSPKEAYRQSPFTDMEREGNSLRIDPFYNFTNPYNNTSHKVKARFFYRGDNIVERNSRVDIIKTIGNMRPNVGLISDIAGGDYSGIIGLLPNNIDDLLNSIDINEIFNNNNINGLLTSDNIDMIFGVLGELFPGAQTTDYADLITWLMNNGLPSDILGLLSGNISDDLIPYVSGLLSPETNKTQVDHFYTYYVDYQFSKKFRSSQLTVGTTFEHTRSESLTTGNHDSDNIALFAQYDHKFFDKLNVSVGARAEYYRVDSMKKEAQTKIFGTNAPFKPVFRGGINYELAPYSFIRASFGQGYRYPSLTEKYARKDVGGVGVYPNENVKAEEGFNAEIGFKQGYKIGRFQGFLDVAGFYTQYKNMIEFQIGFFNNTAPFKMIDSTADLINGLLGGGGIGLGAQFYNVDKARIYGYEINTTGFYAINKNMKLNYNIGYVYIEPRDANYKKKNEIEESAEFASEPLKMKEKSNNSKYLKYRPKHTFKATLDYEWNRVSIGTNLQWKSRILAVDYIMVDERPRVDGKYRVMDYVRDIVFGNINGETLNSYWKEKNKDYFLMDFRFGVKVTDEVRFQFMVNNLLNKEYSTRPMAVGAPRTYVFQVGLNF